MEKIFLTDNPRKFFDAEVAEEYKKPQLTKEVLYCTPKGTWIWTNGKVYGPDSEVKEVTHQEAAQWFDEHGYDFEEIPEDLQQFLGEEI